ncbi:hypothetical protein JYU34_017711 [Plutella xylostella]|uniref:Uncharacterized protein n=2 Tax=Plutella xylostella TaxID=51655 RepID=A0ABQ7Q1Q1_PLUXY|nr:hypothetical protein JYU34_017711 [Plutella xylostella]
MLLLNLLSCIVLFGFTSVYAQDVDEFDLGTTEASEEEWHMDFVPTGYLPDSVYRELAWYGILQIQPLFRSSKYKIASQLIWQHTLGRPHVILENSNQATPQSSKESRQVLAELAAKWSRGQRAAQEVLMENIKNGGNGVTVRTVIGAGAKTVYMIQNGNYFKCPEGSEPDVDAYRQQVNMHDRKCTFNKIPEQLSVDPCIEGEVAPIEYSYKEGWTFCMGSGDRDTSYFQNGTLDCGNKTKVTLDEFLSMCAIDNNIVITYEYFGDEPRKDLLHNATICSTWDPCHLSYLYRLEPPAAEMIPVSPSTTINPCETTPCPECMENGTEDPGVEIDVLSDDDNK